MKIDRTSVDREFTIGDIAPIISTHINVYHSGESHDLICEIHRLPDRSLEVIFTTCTYRQRYGDIESLIVKNIDVTANRSIGITV